MTRIETDFTLDVQTVYFLVTGYYDVLLTGGLYYKPNSDFTISLINQKTQNFVPMQTPLLPTGDWMKGKRTALYARVDIPEKGDYELRIINREKLELYKAIGAFGLFWKHRIKPDDVRLAFLK